MKYLSKLLGMFLVGSMLMTAGCADYDEDIRDLNTKIEDVQTSFDERLSEMESDLEATQGELDELIANIEASKSDLEALKNAYEAFKKSIEEANYDQQIVDALKEFEDKVKELETLDQGFRGQLSDIITNIATNKEDISEINGVLTLVDQQIKDLEARITEAENRLKKIEDELALLGEQLASLIQNITFVPEYTDGLATAARVIGPKGSTLSATTLTAVFEVTPSSAAHVLAQHGRVTVEPLKTRAAVLQGERLVVEEIEGQPGRVKVTAFVHNMPADFNSYAFTLNVAVEENVIASSDYVYIHENDEPEYQYALVTEEGNEPIENHANWDAERKALVFENKWTNADEQPVLALDGYAYKLTNGKDYYSLTDIEKRFGMAENALAVTLNAEISDEDAEFVSATSEAAIDMLYDNEYQMYHYINREAEIALVSKNDAFLEHTVKAYYKVGGVDVVDGTFTIEEEGDLYWLSQNQNYVFGEKKASKVVFANGVELDMAGYCDAQYDNAPYKSISPSNVVTINGNGATVKNLVVNAAQDAGLFGYIKGSVSDLSVVGAKITGNHWAGGIAGRICGPIKNCHVDSTFIEVSPRKVNGAWDDGDKAGGIVGYSEPNAANTPAEPIENCSVKNTVITAFRDLAGIVGAMYYGDNLKNNVVNNVELTAVQRESLYKGYNKDANIGRILGRDLMSVWEESKYASNSVDMAYLRIRYAEGAEVNVNSFDPAEHTLEISSANGLAWFSNYVKDSNYFTYQNVAIVNDIDFNNKLYFEEDDVKFTAIGNKVKAGVWRTLNFDGMNNTIYNFEWKEDVKDIALFGEYKGNIKNIKMVNVNLQGVGRVAPIAAQCWGNIDNCHVTNAKLVATPCFNVAQNAYDDGDKVGGIVAQMQKNGNNAPNGTITNCSVTNVDIEGYRDLGGLAGHAELASYDNSNKFANVVVWVNQTCDSYVKKCTPFENEGEVVGRADGSLSATTPADVEGVEIYNIRYSDLGRRYVEDPSEKLYLGYAKYSDIENAKALRKFAEEYMNYKHVIQVTDMQLLDTWNAIGTDAVPFVGTYDGNGKAINGMRISSYNTTPSGFFGVANGHLTGINIVRPDIYGCHYAGAIAAKLYGTVSNCNVSGGLVVLMPNVDGDNFDNGDKAGALVGYLAASGNGSDKIINNTVDGVTVRAYRDVAALVGCANEIYDMSGNIINNCTITADQVVGAYLDADKYAPNIGILIGRLISTDTSKIKDNVIKDNNQLSRYVKTEEGSTNVIIDLVEVGSIGK